MGLRQEISRVVAVAIAIALTGATADAQNTSADILQALTPSTLTSKSLSAPPAITEEDQVFVKSLAGKAITVEARQQVAEIIEVYELPQIDLTVEFAFNSATLSAQAKATLNKLGEAI